MTIPEAVKASGVGRSTIYAEIAAGGLRARKIGRRTLILADDLRAWLEGLPTMHAARGGRHERRPEMAGEVIAKGIAARLIAPLADAVHVAPHPASSYADQDAPAA